MMVRCSESNPAWICIEKLKFESSVYSKAGTLTMHSISSYSLIIFSKIGLK